MDKKPPKPDRQKIYQMLVHPDKFEKEEREKEKLNLQRRQTIAMEEANKLTKNTANVTNNTIVIGSNNTVSVTNQIQQLPDDVQETAKKLLSVLQTALKEKKAPKKFKERFGDFVKNYAHLVPAFGNLALQLLTLL